MTTTELETVLQPEPDGSAAPVAFRRIVVPLDGSPLAEAALAPVTEIALRTGAPALLVHAVAGVRVPDVDAETAPALGETDARIMLERAAARLRQAGVRADELLVLPAEGDEPNPAQAVLTTLRRTHDADLIVMTTHGRTGLRRAVFGSVAEAIVRRASVPVLLVPPAALAAGGVRLGTDDTAALPSCVMVALDGSALSEAASEPAAALASAIGAGVALVSIVPEETLLHAPSFGERATARAARDVLSRRADSLIEAHPHLPFVRTGTVIAAPHQVPQAILDRAGEIGARTVALATHARTGLHRLVRGSVTAEVVKSATVPVLVTGPRLFEPRRK
jgi:nucleotide-binding universal stress UspA family protein